MIVSDPGHLHPTAGYPANYFLHLTGWNALYLDGRVNFMLKGKIARQLNFTNGVDYWVQFMSLADRY